MKLTDADVTRYADMFAALGAEPRLRIVRLLLSAHPDGMVVDEIQAETGVAGSTLSHHLEKLKNDELVTAEREKAFIRYRANTDALEELLGFLYAECCTRNKADRAARESPPSASEERHEYRTRQRRRSRKYGQAALRARDGRRQLLLRRRRGVRRLLRSDHVESVRRRQEGEVPDLALKASLGCGNPTALAELKPGETVLDLGSGGGIDVLLSARRVGPTGKAYGLDMTDEMLALAEENKRKSGLENVEFLKGEIEHIPLPDNSVDVIISNCVINLSGDKDRVLRKRFAC